MSSRARTPVELTINRRAMRAQPGETVLSAARRAGVHIPALCHEEGIPAWGGCRLCLVEVEGRAKLQAACTTQVAEGMLVLTDTPRVRRRRERFLKMYLSDHDAYCEAPCAHACPAHIDIPAFIAALKRGDNAGAAAIVRADLPFPGVLGRVCPRPCEPVCRRGSVDEPVAICALHRAAADHCAAKLVPGTPTGRRVAAIGAGPAGLTAAWYLAELGHEVTVYDTNPKPGGSLRYSIPAFRLPEKVLERELEPLWQAGVRFVGETALGYEVTVEGLLDAGFDAVVVGIGTWQTATSKIAGSEAVMEGLDLLRGVREGRDMRLTDKVAVIGGGTTALDVARTARRLGASSVTVLAPRDAAHLEAGARDLEATVEEGVAVEFDVAARRVKAGRSGRPSAVECVRLGHSRGRTREIKDSRFDVSASTVVSAVSYVPDLGDAGDELAVSAWKTLEANYFTGRTAARGVFAAGDAVTGTRSVIHAVAAGKRAALAVDAWLAGTDLVELEEKLAVHAGRPYLEQLADAPKLGALGERLAERNPVWLEMGIGAETAKRATMPKAGKARRTTGFHEVEKGYSVAATQAEAKRCLQCVCPSLGACDLQKLGVEYGITSNDLVAPDARVRRVEPRHEHPFIHRDMGRCIACGRCVRVCRDVAGPACFDFTGRGFAMKIDTPFGEALQMADCIACGRCVTACPTGALTFNERTLQSFRIDEARCLMCRECVAVCPVDALRETNRFAEARSRWLELVTGARRPADGHHACAGCGAPIVVRQVLMGTSAPVVVSAAAGRLEVSPTIYPHTSEMGCLIHTGSTNAVATLSGVEAAFRALEKKGRMEHDVRFIAFGGGDDGACDNGLQSLASAMERGHQILYVCHDNGAATDAASRHCGATPACARSVTSPASRAQAGVLQRRRNLTDVMIAHGLRYVAQASPHDPRDLLRKAAKALETPGPTFLNILAPCPRDWGYDSSETIDLARQAVDTCYWPLFELEDGESRLTYRPKVRQPLAPWLRRQGRFAHLFEPGDEGVLEDLQNWVDGEWDKLLASCCEPSQTVWEEQLARHGCMYVPESRR